MKHKSLLIVCLLLFVSTINTFASTGTYGSGYGTVELIDYKSGSNNYYQTNHQLRKSGAGVYACVRFQNDIDFCRFTANYTATASAAIFQPTTQNKAHFHNWYGYDNVSRSIEILD